jgi:hypothetical protein
VHEFHVHVSVAPADTLSSFGVYLLLVTVNDDVDPFGGGGGGGGAGGSVTPFDVDDPPPPHANNAATRNTETVLKRLRTTKLVIEVSTKGEE